jgi:pimeloyl-ACP methyl ester carboxylesterase
MTSHFVRLDGQRFHYLEWGRADAPVMLLLHGFPEYSGAWAELAPLLAAHYRVIAPDQRGYGQSWAPPEVAAYGASQLVEDMCALLDRLAPGQAVTVMGHDWGAAVAYALAIRHPDRVARLIVANGVHPAPFQRALAAGGAQSAASQYIEALRAPGSEDRLAADDFDGLMRLFSAHMDLSWMTPPKRAAYKAEWARPGCLRGMVNWYRASPLRVAEPGQPITDLPAMPADKLRVAMPHLLIWGDGDTALLPESIEGLEDYAPRLTVRHIPDADHWICHQQPRKLAALIHDWIAHEAPTEY